MTCIIERHINITKEKNNKDHEITPTEVVLDNLKKRVNNSQLPNLMSRMGNYVEPDEELIKALNFDFRIRPSLLQAVTKLHTGIFVSDRNDIFILVAESYGRAKSIGIHSETNLKSIPNLTNTKLYNSSLCAGIFEEADGHAIKRKLKIGTKTMNILSTMSINLGENRGIDIGPFTSAPINSVRPNFARVFCRQECVKEFFESFYNQKQLLAPVNLSCLRKLVSSFNHCSTFAAWRASVDEINSDCLLPTTVFTLCDMSHNEGYGSSNTSVEKMASRFMQALAISYINSTTADFSAALKTISAMAKTRAINKINNNKDCETLITITHSLQQKMSENKDLDALTTVMLEDYSSIGRLASNRLSDSNNKVKENVDKKLVELFGPD